MILGGAEVEKRIFGSVDYCLSDWDRFIRDGQFFLYLELRTGTVTVKCNSFLMGKKKGEKENFFLKTVVWRFFLALSFRSGCTAAPLHSATRMVLSTSLGLVFLFNVVTFEYYGSLVVYDFHHT